MRAHRAPKRALFSLRRVIVRPPQPTPPKKLRLLHRLPSPRAPAGAWGRGVGGPGSPGLPQPGGGRGGGAARGYPNHYPQLTRVRGEGGDKPKHPPRLIPRRYSLCTQNTPKNTPSLGAWGGLATPSPPPLRLEYALGAAVRGTGPCAGRTLWALVPRAHITTGHEKRESVPVATIYLVTRGTGCRAHPSTYTPPTPRPTI